MLRKNSKEKFEPLGTAKSVDKPFEVYTIHELPDGWPDDRQWCKPRTIYGYRVNTGVKAAFLSMFISSHNEFWNIWSDVIPFLTLIVMFFCHLGSNHFNSASSTLKLLEVGVFAGPIISRGASSFYHTFNSVSSWTRERLINIDLLGICSMSFCSPYFYFLGNKLLPGDVFDKMSADIYLTILLILFVIPVLMFFCNLRYGESQIASKLRQVVLVILAGWGNIVAVRLVFGDSVPFFLRFICFFSVFCFITGYFCCFIKLMSEVFCQHEGVSDGKIWNSHVIWHIFAALAQIGYCMVPLCYSCKLAEKIEESNYWGTC